MKKKLHSSEAIGFPSDIYEDRSIGNVVTLFAEIPISNLRSSTENRDHVLGSSTVKSQQEGA